MKKALILTVIALTLILSSCGETDSSAGGGAGSLDLSKIDTMAAVFSIEGAENTQTAFTDTDYIYVFNVDGISYRAVAELPADISEAIWALDFEDEDRDQKVMDMIAPLKLKSLENLSEKAPTQDDLDKLIGKTGQELFDDGWTYWYYNLEDMEAGMNHDAYSFIMRFAYDGEQMQNTDDFDFYEEFKDLTVESVTYDGIGDATNI